MSGKRLVHEVTKSIRYPNRLILIGCLILLSILVSSCACMYDPETSQIHHDDVVAVISPENQVVQSVWIRNQGTSKLIFWLRSDALNTLTVRFHRSSGELVAQKNIDIHPGEQPQSYILEFDSLKPTGPISIELSVQEGEISLYGRDENVYAQGDLMIAGSPQSADAGFELEYTYGFSHLWSDLRQLFSYWWVWIAAAVLLVFPGWLLLSFSELPRDLDWIESTGLSIALSISLISILYLWATVFGIPITRTVMYFLAGLSILLVIIQSLRRQSGDHKGPDQPHISNSQLIVITILVFSASLLLRLAMVRDLAAPPWVDSIHHGVLTRAIIEQSGLPDGFSEILPQEARYYHLGYHSLMSAFLQFTSMDMPEAMLVFGQLLNALSIFAVYLFAKSFTQRQSTGILAMVVVGLFSPLPAYLTSWGRYTHLLSLLILPALLFVITRLNKREKSLIRIGILASFLFAGLILVHYRVAFFTIILVLVYVLVYGFITPPEKWFRQFVLISFGLSALILAPWLIPTFRNLLIPKAIAWGGGEQTLFSGFSWRFLTVASGKYILGAAVLGSLFAIIFKSRMFLTQLIWIALMFFAANLGALGLPDPGFINNLSVEINLFLPIGLFAAFGVDESRLQLRKYIPVKWTAGFDLALLAVLLAGSVYGAVKLLPILNPVTFLARESDLTAIEWIEDNLPDQEVILINPQGWGYGLYMGADGGYWISPLAGNPTIPPPVLYGLGSIESITETNTLIEDVMESYTQPASLWDLMAENEIDYLFIGDRGGIFSSKTLASSELFEIVHQSGTTRVFKRIE